MPIRDDFLAYLHDRVAFWKRTSRGEKVEGLAIDVMRALDGEVAGIPKILAGEKVEVEKVEPQ